MTPEQRAAYREEFRRELAALLGVEPDALPTSVSKEDAAAFLGLKNPRTFNVWKNTGRHRIAVLTVGRELRPMTSWLLDTKAGAVCVAGEAA